MRIVIPNNILNFEVENYNDNMTDRTYLLHLIATTDEYVNTNFASKCYITILNGKCEIEVIDKNRFKIIYSLNDEVELDFIDIDFTYKQYGKLYGYPECCVDSFIARSKSYDSEGTLPEEFNYTTPLDGSGFIACLEHSKLSKDVLIELINKERQISVPFKEEHTVEEDFKIHICKLARWCSIKEIELPKYMVDYLNKE